MVLQHLAKSDLAPLKYSLVPSSRVRNGFLAFFGESLQLCTTFLSLAELTSFYDWTNRALH